MKQHISEQQFNKLSAKAKRLLKQWTIDKGYATDSLPEEMGYGYQFEPEDDGKIWTAYPRFSKRNVSRGRIGRIGQFLLTASINARNIG